MTEPLRLEGRGLSRARLRALCEDASRPAVLLGLTEGWRAREAWAPRLLAARFAARRFDVGRASRATCWLSELLARAEAAAAVASAPPPPPPPPPPPEYVFDSAALDEEASLAADFSPPPCFPPSDGLLGCVFAAVPALRPEWRWLLVGARGAGFSCHVDPHGTCAWNALLTGRKRWAMLPPDTPAALVLPSQAARAQRAEVDGEQEGEGEGEVEGEGEGAPLNAETEGSAHAWLAHQLPRLASMRVPGLLEFEQAAGETVFVPAGWWHCAETISSEVTVAVTQNYLGEAEFERLCERAGPEAAARWRERAHAAAGSGDGGGRAAASEP